jgi:hypothetical protein
MPGAGPATSSVPAAGATGSAAARAVTHGSFGHKQHGDCERRYQKPTKQIELFHLRWLGMK